MIKYKYKLFGRFKGRKKILNISGLNIDKYLVDIKKDINVKNYNILDIGSGSGENAIYLAKKHPDSIIITCELFEDGNINLIKEIINKDIKNIKLYRGNVLEFLDKVNIRNIFNEVWVLYPDPWPKTRHHKRRLINDSFLEDLYFYIKLSGRLCVATDSSDYIFSILNNINSNQVLYSWKNQKVALWNYSYLSLPETKFYKKALKSNRKTMFFELSRI